MVWQRLRVWAVAFCVMLAVGSALRIHASAATVTPYDGTISSSYTQIFQDILPKKSFSDNYVFLRSGQNEYKMYFGKFLYENQVLTADGSCYGYTLNVNSGYNSGYSFSQFREDNVVIDPGSALIYSDLGPWPTLQEPVEFWMYAIFLLGLIWLMYGVIHWLSEVK